MPVRPSTPHCTDGAVKHYSIATSLLNLDPVLFHQPREFGTLAGHECSQRLTAAGHHLRALIGETLARLRGIEKAG